MADRNATVAEGWLADPDIRRGFIAQARYYAQANAICTRRVVGAVVVAQSPSFGKDGSPAIVGVGWNGTPKGMTECDEGGCPRGMLTRLEFSATNRSYDYGSGRCTALHAETAAVMSYLGHAQSFPLHRLAGMFCTHKPCWNCLVVAWGAGIPAVFYPHPEAPEAADPVSLLHGEGLD